MSGKGLSEQNERSGEIVDKREKGAARPENRKRIVSEE